jgi:DtxR family transcriptional regulator, Mn-dependent transcriptional regulator
MISQTEENYLKAIYKITERDNKAASTNAIAAAMNTTAASVTDMFNRLKTKNLVHYAKAKGVTLTTEGGDLATSLIRKHRIWEVFLCEKLGYTWDECHDLAEELEHVQDNDLTNRLDRFLGFPRFDPHGDPIPDADGNFTPRSQVLLSEMKVGEKGVIVGVQEHSSTFLQYLDKQKLTLGVELSLLEIFEFDDSIKLNLKETGDVIVSSRVSQNLFLKKIS